MILSLKTSNSTKAKLAEQIIHFRTSETIPKAANGKKLPQISAHRFGTAVVASVEMMDS